MPLIEKNNAIEIGRQIKLLRIRNGLTLQEASSCTGLSTLVLSQIENGNYSIFLAKFSQYIEIATLYARYFDCDINECVGLNSLRGATAEIDHDEFFIPYFLRKKSQS